MREFNTVNFCILGMPAYFFCSFSGFVIATCTYIVLIAAKKYNLSQSIKILLISFIGMILGAKLFGYFTGIYRSLGLGKTITIDSLLDTGIVYYGGLLGVIGTYTFCLKRANSNLDAHTINVLSVCIPLFHAIARIGCFLSGCCYGKKIQGVLAVNYTVIIEGSVDVNSRFPVQIAEAIFELLIFFYLLMQLKKSDWKDQNLLARYLTIYSIGRFFLEFLRGDMRRGLIYGVSFSQCISVLIWIVLMRYYWKRRIVQRQKREDCNG